MELKHPLLREEEERPKFPTPPLEEWTNAIMQALRRGSRGTNLLGRSGDGKTEAGKILKKRPMDWMPNRSPIYHITVPHHTSTTDSKFYKFLQEALGLSQHPFSAPQDRLRQIGGLIIEECYKVRSKRFFLIIDEAQRLHAEDYLFLCNIDDFLSIHDHRIMCIFIHQIDTGSNSTNVADESKKSKRSRNIDRSLDAVEISDGRRFSFSWHRYRGLVSESDFSNILKSYGVAKYKGKTFLEEWAPGVAESGARLEDIAPIFVDAVIKIREEHKLVGEDCEVAMAILEPAIVYLLTEISSRNPDFKRFELAHVKEALRVSGYLQLDALRQRQRRIIVTEFGPRFAA